MNDLEFGTEAWKDQHFNALAWKPVKAFENLDSRFAGCAVEHIGFVGPFAEDKHGTALYNGAILYLRTQSGAETCPAVSD